MQCPKCGREIKDCISPADLAFCPYCGENIASESTDHFSFCPACGCQLPPGAMFCPRCGKKLITAAEEKPPTENIKATPLREDIGEVMAEEVAEPTSEPRAVKPLRPSRESFWPKFKVWFLKVIDPARDFISGQWRLRRLYRKWAKEGVFSPEEIPSAEALARITKEARGQQPQPLRLTLAIAVLLVLMAFFIGIGIVMSRCG